MTVDPNVPNDLKKRVMNGVRDIIPGVAGARAGAATSMSPADVIPGVAGVRAGAIAGAGATPDPRDFIPGYAGARAGAREGTNFAPANTAARPVIAPTIEPTPDAIAAGPARGGPIDADRVAPSSPLDAGQPLPAGVREYKSAGYHGSPGTNDVIYEGATKNGVRSFSNNQFSGDLRRGSDPALDALAKSRSGEIGRYVQGQRDTANAAANAAAVAPKNADEQTTRIKALSDIQNSRLEAGDKHTAAGLAAVGKAGENLSNDFFTQQSTQVRDAALKAGASPEEANSRGNLASATLALDAGLDPSDKSLPPNARAGHAQVNRSLADIFNTRATTGFAGSTRYGGGKVIDPDALDASKIDIGSTPFTGRPTLISPPDEHGERRTIPISPSEAEQLTPYIRASQRGGLNKRRALVSDRK